MPGMASISYPKRPVKETAYKWPMSTNRSRVCSDAFHEHYVWSMVAKQALPGVSQSIINGQGIFPVLSVSPLGAIPSTPCTWCPVELSADEISSALQLPVLH
ncbi:hypothetical protein SNK04_008690 [Fusarium graminearum]